MKCSRVFVTMSIATKRHLFEHFYVQLFFFLLLISVLCAVLKSHVCIWCPIHNPYGIEFIILLWFDTDLDVMNKRYSHQWPFNKWTKNRKEGKIPRYIRPMRPLTKTHRCSKGLWLDSWMRFSISSSPTLFPCIGQHRPRANTNQPTSHQIHAIHKLHLNNSSANGEWGSAMPFGMHLIFVIFHILRLAPAGRGANKHALKIDSY